MASTDLHPPDTLISSPLFLEMNPADIRSGRRRSKSEGISSNLLCHSGHYELSYDAGSGRPHARVRLPSPGRKPFYNVNVHDLRHVNSTHSPRHCNYSARILDVHKMNGQSLSPCRENLTPPNGLPYPKDHLVRSPRCGGGHEGDCFGATRNSPPALSENGRVKYGGDWNGCRNGSSNEHALVNSRLNGISLINQQSPKQWAEFDSSDPGQCRLWKSGAPDGSRLDRGIDGVTSVEDRYYRKVEALRSQLLHLDQLRNSVDGKRLRQLSESETNGTCCGVDYRHPFCIAKEPKRPRDYRCAPPFQRPDHPSHRDEAGYRNQAFEHGCRLQEKSKCREDSTVVGYCHCEADGSYVTDEASSTAISCGSSCVEDGIPDRVFRRSSETESNTTRVTTASIPSNELSTDILEETSEAAIATDLVPTRLPETAVKPKPKGKKYVEHPGPHTLEGLRPSLFSHVPPYIQFVMHDEKGPPLPPAIQRHLKWNLSNITPVVVRRTVSNSGYRLVRRSNEWTGTWGKHMKSLNFKLMKDYQKLNHFPGTFQIGRKDRLWKNLFRLITKFGKKEFGFIPRTFVLPQDSKLLRSAWERSATHEAWIVKPPASARGAGIKVIHRWGHIPKKRPLVVQKYIERPYLINGSKFDLRLYVLVTSVHPLRIYMYDDGLVRFASVKYSGDPASLADRYMHLTNYSINKLSSMYTQNEDASACKGHKWTIKSLWKYLSRYNVDVDALWKRLVDLSIKTIISGESSMNQLGRAHLNSRYCCYELFGLDVLFDQDLKPWLLEVNISPSLHSTSPLDLAVKGPMVRDLMNMVGHQVPNKLTPAQQDDLIRTYKRFDLQTLCFDKRLYTVTLSVEEREKHLIHQQANCREEYLPKILEDLTADDVRHLIQFEDELSQCGRFQKVFPTPHTHEYHQFFESPRYYNMVMDAWETKYHTNREEGIRVLEAHCKVKRHLEIPVPSGRVKCCTNQPNLPNNRRQPLALEGEGSRSEPSDEIWMERTPESPTETKRMFLSNPMELASGSRLRSAAASVLSRAVRSRTHKTRVTVRSSPVCPPGVLSHLGRSSCHGWTNLSTTSPEVLDAALGGRGDHTRDGRPREFFNKDDDPDVMLMTACS